MKQTSDSIVNSAGCISGCKATSRANGPLEGQAIVISTFLFAKLLWLLANSPLEQKRHGGPCLQVVNFGQACANSSKKWIEAWMPR